MIRAVRSVVSLALVSIAASVLACGQSAGSQLNGPCNTITPCQSGLACGYAITAGCTTMGICVPTVPLPGQAQCQGSSVACGCNGGVVAYGCFFYSGYAPAPVDLTVPLSECLPTTGGAADGGSLATPDGAVDGAGPATAGGAAADGAPSSPADSGG